MGAVKLLKESKRMCDAYKRCDICLFLNSDCRKEYWLAEVER